MGILQNLTGAAGRFLAGAGMGYNLPKVNILGKTPQGIGAALAGQKESFPTFRGVQAVKPLPRIVPKPPTPPVINRGGGRVNPSPTQPTTPPQEPSRVNPVDYQAGMDLGQSKEDEAARVANERVRRYGEVITPISGEIDSYLSSRPDIRKLFEDESAKQGVQGRISTLGGFEKDVTNLQGQLETIPTEDINRRKETGMLTSAAERRIRSDQERPIREQLLRTQGAVSSERVGLDRAYQLVGKMLDMQREQEKRGLEPIQTKLEGARGEFSNEVDAMATKLTGFNQARTDQLSVFKAKIANDQALSLQEQKQAADLQKQELEHLNTMEQIAARKRGEAGTIDKTPEIEALQARVAEGATDSQLVEEFVKTGVLDLSTVEKQMGKFNDILSANNEAAKIEE